MRLFVLFFFILLTSACAQSPDSSSELAQQGLFDATFSSDGKYALIASQLHGASYWQLNPLERKYSWNHDSEGFTQITAVALSSNGQRAASAHKNQWVLWDTSNGKSLAFWQTPADISSIALSDDGQFALIGQSDGKVWYTNTANGDNVLEFKHSEAVKTLAISDQTSMALTGSDDYKAKFWSIESGELLHTIELKNMCRKVAFSPSGKHAFVSSLRGEHSLIDTKTFALHSQIKARYTNYNSAVFDEPRKRLYLSNQQGYIQSFDMGSGDEQTRFHAKRKGWFGGIRSVVAIQLSNDQLKAITSDGQLQNFTLSH